MIQVDRFVGNPILAPNPKRAWEAEATFNGCPILTKEGNIHLLYRAMSAPFDYHGVKLELSTIGHAESTDKTTFLGHRQFITPEHDWEEYGCEDPRITKLGNSYYIFYTALSSWPPNAESIKVAVAITRDFLTIDSKHLITPFNAKAMSLFPEKINGKYTAILTANTDLPPSTIAIAQTFDEETLWNVEFWQEWYKSLPEHAIHLLRSNEDQVEVGAPPILTDQGWILLYSYIKNYKTSYKTFGIEAVLLSKDDPRIILGRTETPLLVPDEDYELYGKVPNVIFPSGALLQNDFIGIYYGATDTTVALATVKLSDLMDELLPKHNLVVKMNKAPRLVRFSGNPIITPNPEHHWESVYTFNPGAIYEGGMAHILYRAQGAGMTSVLGYASARDGCHIETRLPKPVYFPRDTFEMKLKEGFSGCEDPRLTRVGDRIYMCYTAYNAVDPPRVAVTSINIDDFLHMRFNWDLPIEISQPDIQDKNSCILPEHINGEYVVMHRLEDSIWIDHLDSLEFGRNKWIKGGIMMKPRPDKWDSEKIGIGPPPIKTKAGWLLIYHALSKQDGCYRLGAALLEANNPMKVISRLDGPILEPEAPYEHEGYRPKTVFGNGAVLIGDRVFVYYGASDAYVCVASCDLSDLLDALLK
jgi:beta-1,2-mannobiose phosphorylase / 1,2-beta-oligomannan phosphorylase